MIDDKTSIDKDTVSFHHLAWVIRKSFVTLRISRSSVTRSKSLPAFHSKRAHCPAKKAEKMMPGGEDRKSVV